MKGRGGRRGSAVSQLKFTEADADQRNWGIERRIMNVNMISRGRQEGDVGTSGEVTMRTIWSQYLKARRRRYRSDLRNIEVEEGLLIVAEFAAHLMQQGLSKPQLDKAVSDLRSVLLSNGCRLGAEQLTGTATNPLLARVKKGHRGNIIETRTRLNESAHKQALPIIKEMLQLLFGVLWVPGDWTDRISIDGCGYYGLIVLGINYGIRPSNLLRGDWKRDSNGERIRNPHFLRKQDMIWILFDETNPNAPFVIKGSSSQTLRSTLNLPRSGFIPMEQSSKYPQALKFHLLSSKTTQTTKDRGLAAGTLLRTLGGRNEEEKRHLNCLFSWALNADPHDTMECFFARSTPSEKYLLKKELVGHLRDSAASLGLDPKNYTAKSMRTTYMTYAAEAGIPMEETNRMAGLVPNSRMSETTYNMGTAGLTTALLMERAIVPIEHLKARTLLGRKGTASEKNA
jgi:hypothetical protein